MWRHYPHHCLREQRLVRGRCCCSFSFTCASSHWRVAPFSSHVGGTGRLLGPTLLQRQVSCIRRNPHTLLTRMQLAHTQTHTQTCRHTTDSNLACMITAALSCLGVLSHLALVFVAYPAACPAARIHRI